MTRKFFFFLACTLLFIIGIVRCVYEEKITSHKNISCISNYTYLPLSILSLEYWASEILWRLSHLVMWIHFWRFFSYWPLYALKLNKYLNWTKIQTWNSFNIKKKTITSDQKNLAMYMKRYKRLLHEYSIRIGPLIKKSPL